MKKQIFILLLSCPLLTTGQDKPIIGKELGILQFVLSKPTDKIEILNEDLSVWMCFDYTFEEKLKGGYTFEEVKKKYNWKEEFSPFVFHLDYHMIMFKCLEENKGLYKVIIDENKGLIKYIRKSSSWTLRSWEKYMLESVMSIDFDILENPLKETPSDNARKIEIQKEKLDPYITPQEIKENWLKVKFTIDSKEYFGWLKWKKGNQIIVSLWYLD